MNILYATETYLPTINGASIFTCKLALEMFRRGHEVSVITVSSDFKSHIQKEDNVMVYRLPSFPTILKPSQRMGIFNRARIFELIKQIKPDLAHIQNHFFIGSSALEAANRLKIPAIGTNHMGPGDVSHFLPLPDFMVNLIDKLIWKHLAGVFNKCAYLTAPSKFAFALFAKYGVNLPGEVISNGVELDMFTPAKSGRETRLKEKHSLPDKPIVLYAGRLEPGKGLEVWIRSIPYVLEKAEAHFILVGPGISKKALQKLARSLKIEKNISFVDPMPYAEMPDFYRLADLFAISSIIETQGLVVLEAMASGLPVVAADFAALPELVKDGENGFLFEAGHSKMMGEKITKILNDPDLARIMGEKSLEFAKEHAIWKTYDSFEKLYQRLIKGG